MTKKTLFLLKGVFNEVVDQKYKFSAQISTTTDTTRTNITELSVIKNDGQNMSFF